MDVSSLSQNNSPAQMPAGTPVTPVADSGSAPFSKLLESLLQSTNSEQQGVDDGVKQLLTGETDNLHEVSMAVARADLSFRFLMQVRDQLIGAYREVMRMQV